MASSVQLFPVEQTLRDGVMGTQRYGHVDSNQSAGCDQEQGLAIPPADPARHKKSGDFGRNFNPTVNEVREVNVDAET